MRGDSRKVNAGAAVKTRAPTIRGFTNLLPAHQFLSETNTHMVKKSFWLTEEQAEAIERQSKKSLKFKPKRGVFVGQTESEVARAIFQEAFGI